jgi:hypothetical protein
MTQESLERDVGREDGKISRRRFLRDMKRAALALGIGAVLTSSLDNRGYEEGRNVGVIVGRDLKELAERGEISRMRGIYPGFSKVTLDNEGSFFYQPCYFAKNGERVVETKVCINDVEIFSEKFDVPKREYIPGFKQVSVKEPYLNRKVNCLVCRAVYKDGSIEEASAEIILQGN